MHYGAFPLRVCRGGGVPVAEVVEDLVEIGDDIFLIRKLS